MSADVEGSADEIGMELEYMPQPPPATLFRTSDPVEVIEKATRVADALKRIIQAQGLYKTISGRHHVLVEAWTTCGAMLGLTAYCVWSRPIGERSEHGHDWEARVEVRTLDGRTLSAAEAMCSRKESKWRTRDDYALRSMAQCVPLSAEILTRKGFVSCFDVEEGDEVLAYDPEADHTVWTPLQAVSIYGPTPTVRMRSRSFDFTCTPEHKWATGTRGLVPANELRTAHDIVVAAPCGEAGEGFITPRDAALIGWVLTDGTLRYPSRGGPRIHIDQSKPEQIERLRQLLGDEASERVSRPAGKHTFPSGATYATREAVRFSLKAHAVRGLLERTGYVGPVDGPRIAACAGNEARRAMLAAMLDADGHNVRGGASWRFGKTIPFVMETFQVLATLEGLALGRMSGFVMSNGAWMPTQVTRVNRVCRFGKMTVEDAGEQPVWCPTTRFGTWVMRHRGNVSITGNTRATSKALRIPLGFIVTLAGYQATPAEEMPDAPEQRAAVPERVSDIPSTLTPEPLPELVGESGAAEIILRATNVGIAMDDLRRAAWHKAGMPPGELQEGAFADDADAIRILAGFTARKGAELMKWVDGKAEKAAKTSEGETT